MNMGTLMIVGAACLIGLPVGIGAGIYAAEYPGTRLARTSRFVADVMNGTPSIVVGVFAWAWIVMRQGHFSGLAGSVALALLIMLIVLTGGHSRGALVCFPSVVALAAVLLPSRALLGWSSVMLGAVALSAFLRANDAPVYLPLNPHWLESAVERMAAVLVVITALLGTCSSVLVSRLFEQFSREATTLADLSARCERALRAPQRAAAGRRAPAENLGHKTPNGPQIHLWDPLGWRARSSSQFGHHGKIAWRRPTLPHRFPMQYHRL